MTAQEAAYEILNEEGRPMPAKEVAELALERGLVSSNTQHPAFSIAVTIDKNIRDDADNEPRLVFIRENGQKCVGLPQWKADHEGNNQPVSVEQRPELLAELVGKLKTIGQRGVLRMLVMKWFQIVVQGLPELFGALRDGVRSQLETWKSRGEESPES